MLKVPDVQTAMEPMKSLDVHPRMLRVLLADTDADARRVIDTALDGLGERLVTHAGCRDQLMRMYFEEGPFDLVVCRADLGTRSGLMARARSTGRGGSFIVYSGVGEWLRVFVTNAAETLLSSRVVSLEQLSTLATGLLQASQAPN